MLPNQFFKLLSDETRFRCLLMIARQGEMCVCDLTQSLQESQPKVSRHLAQLRQSGILIDERRGQWVFYHISPEIPGWAKAIIEGLKNSNCLREEYLQDIQRLVNAEENVCN